MKRLTGEAWKKRKESQKTAFGLMDIARPLQKVKKS
jgi:hypothetical protein